MTRRTMPLSQQKERTPVGGGLQRIGGLHEPSPMGHEYPFVDSNLCEKSVLSVTLHIIHGEQDIRLSLEINR